MNAFAKFGIEHLSASKLNMFHAQPHKFGRVYLKGEAERGPWFWRGTAVEAGLKQILYGAELEVALAEAHKVFEQEAQGEISDEIDAERKNIEPMVKQASYWPPPSEINATQQRIEFRFDSVPIPIIGFVDFCFDGIDVDSKTGQKVQLSWDHVRQASLYRAARKRRGGILYITTKRFGFFEIDDATMEEAIWELEADALALMRQLEKSDNADDFLAGLPNYERFRKRKEPNNATAATADNHA